MRLQWEVNPELNRADCHILMCSAYLAIIHLPGGAVNWVFALRSPYSPARVPSRPDALAAARPLIVNSSPARWALNVVIFIRILELRYYQCSSVRGSLRS